MKKGLWKIIFAILFLLPVCANATTIDFYNDGTITDGNDFYWVNVWDNATVDMTGGRVSNFYTYQTSTVNFSDGNVSSFHIEDTSHVNVSGGFINQGLNVYDSGVANLTGGQIGQIGQIYDAYIAAFESAIVNVYGYGFSYTGVFLNGYWADETPFTIWLRGPGTASHVVLHEIPEPLSILLFGFSGLLIVKQKY